MNRRAYFPIQTRVVIVSIYQSFEFRGFLKYLKGGPPSCGAEATHPLGSLAKGKGVTGRT